MKPFAALIETDGDGMVRERLAQLSRTIDLAQLPQAFEAFVQGRLKGGTAVRVGAAR